MWDPLGICFPEKVPQCQKIERGERLGFFNILSIAKHQKVEGGTLWSRPVLYVTQKTGKTFFGSVR